MGVNVMELIRDMADKITVLCEKEVNLQEDEAKRVGEIVTDLIMDEWGGQLIYVPIGLVRKRALRDATIMQEFTGNNVMELARKYKLTANSIYNIIKKKRQCCAQ